MKIDVVSWVGVAAFLVILLSLLVPWWSIRASGIAIDVYLSRAGLGCAPI